MILGILLFFVFSSALVSCQNQNDDAEPSNVEEIIIKYKVTIHFDFREDIELEIEQNNKFNVLDIPLRNGYTLEGLYYDNLYENKVDFNSYIISDVNIYAKYEKIIEYSISFNSNGGTEFNDIKVNNLSTLTLPTPSLLDYEFVGWYTDDKLINIFNSENAYDLNIELYAKYRLEDVEGDYMIIDNYRGNGLQKKMSLDDINKIEFASVEGAILDGIYKDSKYQDIFDITKVKNGDILYFKWKYYNKYEETQNKYDILPYINNMLDSTTSYIPMWNQEGFKDRWNYIDGVFLNSIVNLYKETNNLKYKEFVKNYVDYYINSNGEFVQASNPSKLKYNSYELDSICESKILFDLYEWYSEEKYRLAIENTYEELMKVGKCSNDLNFEHKKNYSGQILLDGMYMYAPFYARYAKFKNDSTIFDTLCAQYKYIYDTMRKDNGLYYHALDTKEDKAYWADPVTGLSGNVWLRSQGWLLVSLVDVIEYFPEGDNKEFLIKMLSEGLSSIKNYRDEYTKMYWQIVDLGNKAIVVDSTYLSAMNNNKYGNNTTYVSNYLESSGSSMISYAMMKSARLGYIDSSYYKFGYETFEGIYNNSFDSITNTLSDICIQAGFNSTESAKKDGTQMYYLSENIGSNDGKGIGPFVMAFIEYLK